MNVIKAGDAEGGGEAWDGIRTECGDRPSFRAHGGACPAPQPPSRPSPAPASLSPPSAPTPSEPEPLLPSSRVFLAAALTPGLTRSRASQMTLLSSGHFSGFHDTPYLICPRFPRVQLSLPSLSSSSHAQPCTGRPFRMLCQTSSTCHLASSRPPFSGHGCQPAAQGRS